MLLIWWMFPCLDSSYAGLDTGPVWLTDERFHFPLCRSLACSRYLLGNYALLVKKMSLDLKKYLGLNLRIMYLNCIHSELRGFNKLINLSDVCVSVMHKWNGSDLCTPKRSWQFTFTFTHLADAFIQSDLQCIQAIHLLSVHVFPGNRTHNLCAANAML